MSENARDNSSAVVRRVGIKIPHWATQNTNVVSGLVRYLRETRQDWIIDADLDTGHELPPTVIDSSWTGDGLIVFRCSAREAKQWLERGIKVVNISTETNLEAVPSVIPDNKQMGRLAADYLVSLGLRRFVYVGEGKRRYSRERLEGFREILHGKGFDCSEIDLPISKIMEKEKWHELHRKLNEELSRLSFPIGMLTRDDIVAMNVLRSTRALGIKVPDDLALLGINDSFPNCHVASPKLSSVKHPAALIGYYAAQTLDALLGGEKVKIMTRLPSSGIAERESTNVVAVEDELVAKTLTHIRKYAKQRTVSVAEICKLYGLSNTTLRLRFKRVMGHSVKDEIDRVRQEEVKCQLQESRQTIQEIAYEMGFNSPEELTRFFKRVQGESPTKFRQRFR